MPTVSLQIFERKDPENCFRCFPAANHMLKVRIQVKVPFLSIPSQFPILFFLKTPEYWLEKDC